MQSALSSVHQQAANLGSVNSNDSGKKAAFNLQSGLFPIVESLFLCFHQNPEDGLQWQGSTWIINNKTAMLSTTLQAAALNYDP